MNGPADSTPPPITAPKPGVLDGRKRRGSVAGWLRRLFACNPFYLASAAPLLFGCYRISVDPAFLPDETVQLIFNFFSLQSYEVLIVLTAVFLARRRIWYDSTNVSPLPENLLKTIIYTRCWNVRFMLPSARRQRYLRRLRQQRFLPLPNNQLIFCFWKPVWAAGSTRPT